MTDTIARGLADFTHRLALADVPVAVRQRALHLALDATGCALAARREDFALQLAGAIGSIEPGATGRRGVPGFARRLPLRDAIWLSGVLMHGLDYDDTHMAGVLHLSVAVLPAVTALAADRGADGRALLLAYIAGLEAGARVASVVKGGLHTQGFHPTGVVGCFAAALACGKLMGLSADQLVAAQGIALSMASGSLQFLEDGAWTKRLHPGWAAQAGLQAAHLAAHGIPAPAEPYTGRYGLFKSYLAPELQARIDVSLGTAGLGQVWELEQIAIKPFPMCHFVHAAADAAIALHRQGLAMGDIERVDVLAPAGTMPVVCEPIDAKRRPGSDYDAKFSLPYAVASGLLRGRLGLQELLPAAFTDPAALALMDRVHCQRRPGRHLPAPLQRRGVRHAARGRHPPAAPARGRSTAGMPKRPLTNADIACQVPRPTRRLHFGATARRRAVASDGARPRGLRPGAHARRPCWPATPRPHRPDHGLSTAPHRPPKARRCHATESPSPRLPLAGLRVLAVEQYGAGPFGTAYLADLGAEVIKIENHKDGGDVGRHVGPHFFGPGDSQFFQTFNRNKKSLTLDLKHPQGVAVFQRLVQDADAVLDNLRGDLPDKLGLTYDTLKAHNPRIVCAHLSAYGRSGSRRNWPGYDYLMQAEAGHLSLTGEPDGPPTRYGLSIVDLMTGLAAAFGLLAGVLKARASGIGMDIDTSLFDVALHNLNYPGTWYLNGGTVTGRTARSGHPSLVPSQLYRTQDGWLFVMCNKEKFWGLLAQALGHPEWIDDPELCSFAARLKHRDRVTRELDAALMTAPTAVWLERLSGQIPVSPVYDVAQALDNPFVQERDNLVDFQYDDGRQARMTANPIRVPGVTLPTCAAPRMGQHNEALLREAGFDDAAIAKLRALGVVAGG